MAIEPKGPHILPPKKAPQRTVTALRVWNDPEGQGGGINALCRQRNRGATTLDADAKLLLDPRGQRELKLAPRVALDTLG